MSRVIVVAYRPMQGKREELLGLLAQQHRRTRALGMLAKQPPLLCEGTRGEIVYIIVLDTGADVDRVWEDETFQDIDARIAGIATMTPLRTLDEANASYMDLAGLALQGA
ncbi:hypothetical protein L2Y96_12720 [Luteibacter aegosomaticola]|uniref:hypothetical protein n=1 Tax=Luteibacter aegosomaticola TaxID=2911538 RepID=UPI001FF866E4|nr:hypothetical protein [Luteibacter aegosomaticola]UPG88283.1 hypothetical protein L2Y96_12720 [Luteibacter aegosomaticola]